MVLHSENIRFETVSGSATANTKVINGMCNNIVVKPETTTTQYNLKITNSIGAVIYERTSETGDLSELLPLPLHGIYTVSIDSATNDEDFIIQLIIRET